MRVFFASDLHYDVAAGPSATRELAAHLVRIGTPDDVLVLGGDYANTDEITTACLELFSPFAGQILAIAGNHDVWVDTSAARSADRYRDLSALCRTAGIHPLEDEPVIIGGVGFVGAIGWYDYSFRPTSIDVPMEVYETKGFPGIDGPVWNDGRNVNWDHTDLEFTELQLERLRDQLDAVSGADRIVAAIHHVPTDGLLRPTGLPRVISRETVVPRQWLILNTYLGSQRFEELFGEYADKLEVVFCGHIHLARAVQRHGIQFVSNGSDHKQKELVVYQRGTIERVSFKP